MPRNAFQLRALADYASGLRGPEAQDLWITAREAPDGVLTVGNAPVDSRVQPSDAVFQLDTQDQAPQRDTVGYAMIGPTQAGAQDLLAPNRFDAVFWSEAAVEKFVLPYYASKSLWMASHVLSVLSQQWYGFQPGSDSTTQAAEVPFALAHLPSSDYVTLDNPPDEEQSSAAGVLGADLVLLSLDPVTSQVKQTRLSDLL